MMKQSVSYHGKRIKVPFKVRKGICLCCGRKGLTSLHHWKYAYKVKQIRKKPELVLENTSELCFKCHETANAIRKIFEADDKLIKKLSELAKVV